MKTYAIYIIVGSSAVEQEPVKLLVVGSIPAPRVICCCSSVGRSCSLVMNWSWVRILPVAQLSINLKFIDIMAISFHHYHGIDGAMLHRAEARNIVVSILHDPKEGYILSHDRKIIKERLPLAEFMERLNQGEYSSKKGQLVLTDRLTQDTRVVLAALSHGSFSRIANVERWLDHRYSHLIQNKKIILAMHTNSMGDATIESSESLGNDERTIVQRVWDTEKVLDHMKQNGFIVQQSMIPDGPCRINDEEVYYLLGR
ncbi:hypothetical protein LCGC14_2545690 [marine sediment metagenome]|uniref:Uncharacterized protein n=1 Tax=marine sediment metagenome TaxID=412755 RepID=A0A0F9DHH3_9ZZZZ